VFFVSAATSSNRVNVLEINALEMLKFLLVLAGLSLFGQYHNASVITLLEAGGLILGILSFLMLAGILRADTPERATVAPFVGYFIYGCISIVLVALGRQGLPMDASRYVNISFPIAIGLIGFFSVARGRTSGSPLALGALAAMIFVGVFMADRDEFALAEMRKSYLSQMVGQLANWDLQTDPEKISKILNVTMGEMTGVARALAFLRNEHLSYLRQASK
jgi:hypothetical protein